MGRYIFLDSFAFHPSSLDNLSTSCPRPIKERYLRLITSDPEKQNLLIRKACIPYEYLDNCERFDDASLPPPEAFNSTLTNSSIEPEVYERLQEI